MAMQAESPATNPSAQVVGNAFVEQYYHILHQSPELVYRFYQDSSVLSRPDPSGVMTTTTTMEGINERIVSLNYKDYIAEIKTADAQQSLGNGVTVLVTGYLTGTDNVRKKFAQSFFLAPQEKGFFVLNDVFRYVDDEESTVATSNPVDGSSENVEPAAPVAPPEPEQPSPVPGHNVQVPESSIEGDLTNEAVVCDPSDNDEGSVVEEEIVEPPTQLNQNEVVVTVTSEQSTSSDDAPKKSYASILKAMKAASSALPVRAPAKVKPPSRNQEAAAAKAPPASEPLASTSETGPEKSDVLDEAEGHSIYVRNLPQNATAPQLEEVFAKFGPIKQGGVQVRSNKQGFCFGFVEFESLSSMRSAIEASPITIGSRKAVIEEKRTTTRVSAAATNNNGRGRYPSRGGFRSESFRGRGNFSGGRGYGRSDFRNQGEFSSKPRGGGGRGSEGYQRVDQNGTGTGGRQGGQK